MDEQSTVWPDVLARVVAGGDLGEDEASRVLGEVMDGAVPEPVLGALLAALAAKGEAPQEVAGFVRAMLAAATPVAVDGPLLDTCGTGGDGAGTFNISTTAALVCAAAGARVAKHGNRAASSRAGSADLLEAWGIALELAPADVATCLEELGITFLFARSFHPAMRHVAGVRRALGIRTVFNVLGPLANPAGATHQVVGVGEARLAPVMADALARLGSTAMVFHGDDGLDELTTTTTSRVWAVRDGGVRTSVLDPEELGLAHAPPDALLGGDVARNRAIADAVLEGTPGPQADVVALNAAAGLHTYGLADTLAEGLATARDVLASGAAATLRERWAARSAELAAAAT